MFIPIVLILLLVSFILALSSAAKVNEKPEVKDVKKSLDKSRVIFHDHTSASSS
jgi:hypothetical protein